MFYLKYRPKKFSELIGVDNIVATLRRVLAGGQPPHAFLFTGPKGSGKTTTARLIAKALNCKNLIRTDEGIEVCDRCDNCREITEGRFLDLIEIDAASNRGIEDIRSLRERIKLSPSLGKFKVYIIDEAHMLTAEAFNALLKTLEEPPGHAVFILATTELQKIPETIKSRCQVFNFRRADKESLLSKIRLICETEGFNLDGEKMEEIVRLADGGFRDAETLLEQVRAGFGVLAEGSLSVPEFVDLLIGGRTEAAFNFINDTHRRGLSLNVFTQNLLHYLRDLLLVKSGVGKENLSFGDSFFGKLSDQAKFLSLEEITAVLREFIKAAQDFKLAPVPQLPLEMAVVRLRSILAGPAAKEGEESPAGSDGGVSEISLRKMIDEEGEIEKGTTAPLVNPKTAGSDVGAGFLSLEKVLGKWEEILKEVKPENHSLEALLRSSRPIGIDEDGLTLEVFYKFHQEKMSLAGNKAVLERVFNKVLGDQIRIKTVLSEGKKSERSLRKESLGSEGGETENEEIKEAALKAFSGV